MTAIGDHCNTIRSWLNFEYPDALITSWTRMAEEMLSQSLRCKHMIAIDRADIHQERVLLPEDWVDLDFVRVVGGKPMKFRSRDEFYGGDDSVSNKNYGYYTITGNYLIPGGNLDDGVSVELSYYELIPPLGDTNNWLMAYYSTLYTSATLSIAAAYSTEDDRATMWQTATQSLVEVINNRDKEGRSSGSKLVMPKKKGFG